MLATPSVAACRASCDSHWVRSGYTTGTTGSLLLPLHSPQVDSAVHSHRPLRFGLLPASANRNAEQWPLAVGAVGWQAGRVKCGGSGGNASCRVGEYLGRTVIAPGALGLLRPAQPSAALRPGQPVGPTRSTTRIRPGTLLVHRRPRPAPAGPAPFPPRLAVAAAKAAKAAKRWCSEAPAVRGRHDCDLCRGALVEPLTARGHLTDTCASCGGVLGRADRRLRYSGTLALPSPQGALPCLCPAACLRPRRGRSAAGR